MTKLAAFVALTAFAFSPGCQSAKQKRLSAQKDFRDRMCECKDSACALAVTMEEMKWALDDFKSMKLADLADRDDDFERETKEIKAAERACQDKIK